MREPTRAVCTTHKVETGFGHFYMHVDHMPDGKPVGGWISTPGKEPASAIHRLTETLSAALNATLNDVGKVR